ncbi:MAG: hypothetical protein RLY14_230 [Planctomycetota bacterium]|jgi:hypothetical protein
MSCQYRYLLAIIFACSLNVNGVLGQETDPMEQSAKRLAETIEKMGIDKVAVVPLLFLEDVASKQEKERENLENEEVSAVKPILSASNQSLAVAETMERYLAQQSRGEFGLVPSADLFQRLAEAKGDLSELRPNGKPLADLVNPEGDIQAMIVGSLKRFYTPTVSPANGFTILGAERKEINWRLIELKGRTTRDETDSKPEFISLADAVYEGLSVELFRYEGDKLKSLLDYESSERNKLPLRPSDPEAMYNQGHVFNGRVHPLMNPNCPFKVQFEVNGKTLPIWVATNKSTSLQVGVGLVTRENVYPFALVNFEPGERPTIKVDNKTSQKIMVAVFVDGVNIRGKVRQSPDEKCGAWSMKPNSTGYFQHWWTGDGVKQDEMGRFVIEDWKESIAGKLGLSGEEASSRAFTIVFFSDGWPKRENIRFFERNWSQRAQLTSDRKGIAVVEEMSRLGSYAASTDIFGMGSERPVPGQLKWVEGAQVGTILASMTVWYCPKSDTQQMLKRLIMLRSPSVENPTFSTVQISPSK